MAQATASEALAVRREQAEQAQASPLTKDIRRMESEFAKAMPRGEEAVQLVRDAMTVLQKVPKLHQCDSASVLGALMSCAQLGLRPAVLGEAFVLPFWDKQWNEKKGGFRAQLIIGYPGYIRLAQESRLVHSLMPRLVHAEDEFDIDYGVSDTLVHKPARGKLRGDVTDYYAIARFTSGGHAFYTMNRQEMEQHRDRFATTRTREGRIFGPWVDHFDSMGQKGLALDTPLPTPSGWTTMGDVCIGDQLFDMHGQPTTVNAVSEVKNIGCYRVTFANGTTIVCDEEHYWLASIGLNAARDVRTRGWGTFQIGDLFAARAAGKKITMPVVAPINTTAANLPIDPWVLGYWLGNGSKSAAVITCHEDHQSQILAKIGESKYRAGAVRPDPRSKAVKIGIRGGLGKDLADLGVLGHKHVPAIYLRGSYEQRLALLQGLVDSDGSFDTERGRVRFTSVDSGLTNAVAELVRSLGEMVYVNEHAATGYGKTVRAYTAAWLPNICPATISQKVARFRTRQVGVYRSVKSIERVESVPTRCLAVDSLSRTYLASFDMIPTHNTTIRMLAKYLPKTPRLEVARYVDGSLRLNLDPSGGVESIPDVIEHPTVDGAIVDPDGEPEGTVDGSAAIAKPQRNRIMQLAGAMGHDRDGRIAYYREVTHRPSIESTNDLKMFEALKIIRAYEAWQNQSEPA